MAQTAIQSKADAVETAAGGRVDLYAGIHKGLRRFMADTLVAVGRMDVHDAAEVGGTLAQVRGLLELCREHLHTENQFLHPAMEARRPGAACTAAKEHEAHLPAMEQLEAGILAVERAKPATRESAASQLYRRLGVFVAENLAHMAVEETANNAVLWATHTDDELAEIHQAIVASVSPGTMGAFLRWAVPAMTPAERAALFSGIQSGAPREVLERMLAAARPHLTGRDWTKLMAALAPLPLFA
jgi:hypothetical protein